METIDPRPVIVARRASRILLAAAMSAVATFVLVGLSAPTAAQAQTSTLYDFNTPGELVGLFNGVGAGVGSVSQATDGGIGDTGSVTVPLSSVQAVFTSKEGYSLGPVGSTYTFTTFLKSEGNSGHSGVGFTIASPASASVSVAYRPDDALGISVHGGGFVFHNGATSVEGNWNSVGDPAFETLVAGCLALVNECSGPPGHEPLRIDPWFKVVLVVTRTSETAFDMVVEVQQVGASGAGVFPADRRASFALRGITNPQILAAPQLFSYFSFSGTRVTRFDDFAVSLSGGATVVAPGAPVVITEDVAVVGNPTVALAGRVAASGGTDVIERGFVYSSSPGPTVADTKVIFGDGVGEFAGTTALPASGTYYFRTFATNGTTTSYGSERTVVYVSSADSGSGGAPAEPEASQPASEDGAAVGAVPRPTRFDAGGGPAPLVPLPSALALLAVAALLLMWSGRLPAFAVGTSAPASVVRAARGRRLTAFDRLQADLEELRRTML